MWEWVIEGFYGEWWKTSPVIHQIFFVERVNNFASGRPLSQIPQETKTPIFTETWISDIACSPLYSEATGPCRDFFFVSSGACKRRSSKSQESLKWVTFHVG